MRPVLFVGVIISIFASAAPAQGPTSRPAETARARQRWERAVIVFGDESTGQWSLRIRDKDVDVPRQFHFKELWTYDRKTKKWVKVASKPSDSVMAPPGPQKKDDDSEPDQVLVDLPIDPDTVGLFYARWRVDQIDGATFFRLGPVAASGSAPQGKRPAGSMQASVPVDKTHSEADFIPDPRIACEKGDSDSHGH